ncbi:TAD2 [Candida margitis]|uniref:TAD2 n=1 Tax=Candida margitis TaxID=1775924 RepID=UPI00222741AE|nr:TAD2 [Candida margitis]KAI5953802.1 TAD2 [Candida margitis]
MSDLTRHFHFMATALFVGYKALLNNETPVSCIVTRGSNILSIGYNYTNISLNGTKHAEFIALERFNGENIDYSELTLYVTVEPCIMCASYLRQLGIGRVFYGCGNDRFGGNGTILSIHNDTGLPEKAYPSIGGICRTEAIQLLRNFYIQENESAPVPKVKKNKNIEDKEYPLNSFNLSEVEFIDFYGNDRLPIFGGDLEITPLVGQGYFIQEYVNLDELKRVPYLEDELGPIDSNQVDSFASLFYEVNAEGCVNYEQPVDKYLHKKRKMI